MTDTLDLSEAAALLKVDAETARQLAADGEIFGAKIGRSLVFLRDDLIEYMHQKTRAQTAKRRSGADSQHVSDTDVGEKPGRKYRRPTALP